MDTTSDSDIQHTIYHRGVIEEWSNYDSVREEMVSIDFAYVEALRLYDDGRLLGMCKVGAYSTDPADNGARLLSADHTGSLNFTGTWRRDHGTIRGEMTRTDPVTLSARWVGIFYLPGRIQLTAGRVAGDCLSGRVRYDRHPIWGEDGGEATYRGIPAAR